MTTSKSKSADIRIHTPGSADAAMRRPHEMRLIGFDRYEYQLIGEIAVLSGILEQDMKETVSYLANTSWPEGLALVAHLNMSNLCEITASLLESCVPEVTKEGHRLREHFSVTVGNIKKASQERNKLLHGPFSAWPSAHGLEKTSFKMSARGRIDYQFATYDKRNLISVLNLYIDCHWMLWTARTILEKERGE